MVEIGATFLGRQWEEDSHSIEVEVALLGAMITASNAIPATLNTIHGPKMLFHAKHQAIFEAIERLYVTRQPLDVPSLRDELARRRELDRAGGIEYLMELVESVPNPENAPCYARVVYEAYLTREGLAG